MDDVARSTTYPYVPNDLAAPSTAIREPRSETPAAGNEPKIPAYLQHTYHWAYVNPRNVRLLDREIVVRTILWQQHMKLQRLAFAEIQPGQNVLQPASVYGSFAPNLAQHIGPTGRLDVVDVAAVQVRSVTRKLQPYAFAQAHHSNILDFGRRPFDVVCCYFLLHELPDDYKQGVSRVLLESVRPGGKVVFVDYHKPHWAHPIRPITSLVFATLEPYAKGLWRREIVDLAGNDERFEWRKETYFGGLYQKVVATRID